MSVSYASLLGVSTSVFDSLQANNVNIMASIDLSHCTTLGMPVDNVTIEYPSYKIKVKNGGIGTTQLSTGVNATLTQVATNTTDISTLNGEVSTLNSEMTTANANIATNTSNISTLNGEVSTLNSEMTTANANIATNTSNISTLNSELADINILAGKGDLLSYTGSGYARLTVGADATLLIADSSQTDGLKWRVLTSADIPALAYVTSVGLSMPAEFSISGSPVTSSGTLSVTKATQSANLVYAGPTSGSAAAPTFRSLVAADIPSSFVQVSGSTSNGAVPKFNSSGLLVSTTALFDSSNNLTLAAGCTLNADNVTSASLGNLTLTTNGSSNVISCARNVTLASGKTLSADLLVTTTAATDLSITPTGSNVTVAAGKTLKADTFDGTTNGNMTFGSSNTHTSTFAGNIFGNVSLFVDGISTKSNSTDLNISTLTAGQKVNLLRDGTCSGNFFLTALDKVLYLGGTSANSGFAGTINCYFDDNSYYGTNFQPAYSGSFGIGIFSNSAGTLQGKITCSGSGATTYATSSDYRMKTNVAPFVNGLDIVMALKPIIFNWVGEDLDVNAKNAKKKTKIYLNGVGKQTQGFLAHEVADLVPYAVIGKKDDVLDDGTINPQSLDLAKLVPCLVSALQSVTATVQALTARVTALEALNKN